MCQEEYGANVVRQKSSECFAPILNLGALSAPCVRRRGVIRLNTSIHADTNDTLH